ncbi:prepilin-type N-terminal cleavage/methylation domain-containing protein [uncultured Demequina sp.]|uniref:prepilin-type N-terminal cleavage/methylation domain-containing protein n=1 Tax=uncultured Demequina sp. TaxID=693499 RepID=UPI0025EDF063|nr:prepilin-type N-terminal cleavage/methylation domain-containing protein [uncultured Demequina sp.]
MTVPTARRGSESGFSMVELLVVIIIIGILSAIAIPFLMNHRKDANDAAAQSDAMNLGRLVRATWEDPDTTSVAVTVDANGNYVIDGEIAFPASDGVVFSGITNANDYDTWCIGFTHPNGDKAANPGVRFDSQNGYVEQAAC